MRKLNLQLNINQYVCFGLCLLLMAVIPLANSKKIFSVEVNDSKDGEEIATMTEEADGTIIVNTTDIGKDIMGYGGATPVEIRIKDGRITGITTLPNRETPEFFGAVRNSDLIDSFKGKTLQEASEEKVDAVSGATFSSAAIINNIRAGVDYALDPENRPVAKAPENQPLGLKFYVTLFIIVCGALIPIWVKNRNYRTLQLILNVVILGLWGGTFISYSLMVSYLTNGITQTVLIPVVLMLVTAFIYPMFGRTDHYCNWICPYGAAQELIGKIPVRKLKISASAIKYLNIFRQVLWFGLMWLLWTGLWFDWMGYEPFAAFFFKDASATVLGIAGGFLIISLFVSRPYCRFVCPTGSLFKFSEGRN